MSNILALPQLSGTLTAVTNADLRAAIEFVQAGSTSALDLTGITFRSQWRLASDTTQIALDTSSDNGLLVNGGSSGILSWLVPAAKMKLIAPGDYVADLVAIAMDDGGQPVTVNLFQNGPLAVTVSGGLTC